MSPQRIYLSTTIPYVNAAPHLGFALELVQADALARHHRECGREVRFQTGTDDNSLKNVLAAQAEGISTQRLVARNAAAFAALRGHLELSTDDFISTSSDPRHRPGVQQLWQACAARGDFYRRQYEGRYCQGCEQFYTEAELAGGQCPEHGTRAELVREENWFFRLARHAERLQEEISSGRLRIHPATHRNAVLSFIGSGLADFSVSRPAARARGWGIAVPGDPEQVIYVWWDALANYLTALRYGSAGDDYQRWWAGSDRRIHVVGKGVARFHAVYWPAILLSAGLPLPTDVYVHDYLTIGGRRISKSAPQPGPPGSADPAALAARYGTDAVRWWLLRDVPRTGDADFSAGRLVTRANSELAGVIGNLVSRVVTLVHRYRQGTVPDAPGSWPADPASWLARPRPADPASWLARPRPADPASWLAGPLLPSVPQPAAAAELASACSGAPARISDALSDFDFRSATAQAVAIAAAANRFAERSEPWRLAEAELAGDRTAGGQLDAALGLLIAACRAAGRALGPFLPGLSRRVSASCGDDLASLPAATPVFPRINQTRHH